jgi:hypothetical protein
MIPTLYLRKVMSFMNRIHSGKKFDENAYNEFKEIMIRAFPYVARHLTEAEKEQVSVAIMIENIGV